MNEQPKTEQPDPQIAVLQRKLSILTEQRDSCARQALDSAALLNETRAILTDAMRQLAEMQKTAAIPAVAAAIEEAKKVDAKKEEK